MLLYHFLYNYNTSSTVPSVHLWLESIGNLLCGSLESLLDLCCIVSLALSIPHTILPTLHTVWAQQMRSLQMSTCRALVQCCHILLLVVVHEAMALLHVGGLLLWNSLQH